MQSGGGTPDETGPLVVLAPMAGVTNRAFRRLCREAATAVDPTRPGVYVTEMITSRALVERDAETMRMIECEPDETPRSIQLYGVDAGIIGAAVRLLVSEDRADHIDLNFGCPVPKVTRKGGGSALPWKRVLFRHIVRSAVSAADGRVPVTVKLRLGIDDDHLTYLDAGKAAAEEGAAWVALHGRTGAQLYGGTADWDAIARLKEALAPLGTPVLGNGDIWTADDARRMVDQTGCDGVVVGRGCLGRPWLFGQLAAEFGGQRQPPEPNLAGVVDVLRRHAELLVDTFGEMKGSREIRKHIAWYLKGFRVGGDLRQRLGLVDGLAHLDALLAELELDQPAVTEVIGMPRGRTTPGRRMSLPDGWLDSRDDVGLTAEDLALAEVGVSGG
jgi:nifR3 family TIM-barrel protein